MSAGSCGDLYASDLGPDIEYLCTGISVVDNGAMASAEVKKVGDLVMGGKNVFNFASRLKALYLSLLAPCQLVGIFSSIVDTLVSMLHG